MVDRTFTGGRFGIMLDGSEFLGFVKEMSGGLIKDEPARFTVELYVEAMKFECLACDA